MLTLRSLLFMIGYLALTIVWAVLSLLVGLFLPYRWRFQFIIIAWIRMVLFWLYVTCNVRIQAKGIENIPRTPCVILAKHESTLETLFLQLLLVPTTTVIKRELLYVPFFGWAFALLKPISINRAEPRAALKQINKQGMAHLKQGVSVLVFPEGSRLGPGQLGEFYRSGAALAVMAKVPVLPVIHNSGSYWRAHQFIKKPGLVEFSIGPLISTTEKTSKVVTAEAHTWMLEELKKAGWLE